MQTQTNHVVAIVGGACAGAEAASVLAAHGVTVVVFEQNPRPFGKIEDGLPRWHDKQRLQEFARLNEKLNHPRIHFVPLTRLGKDLSFHELACDWGFSAVLLAQGAWKDRPLGLPGVDTLVGRGLRYQNSFIHWFNHYNEKAYAGPDEHPADSAIVVGGGLASIDVVKVLMLETVAAALAARGIAPSVLTLEHKGIAAVLAEHKLDLNQLGLKGCCLYYRRRIQDMPLIGYKDHATPDERHKTEETRVKLIEMAQAKYQFRVAECHLPVSGIVEGDHLVGLRFIRTEIRGHSVAPIPGTEYDVRSALTVSSIGSIPEPITGITMAGEFYRFKSTETGQLEGFDNVFGVGNVVVGKGNIAVSRRHGKAVAENVMAAYLGVGPRELLSAPAAPAMVVGVHDQVEKIMQVAAHRSPLTDSAVSAIEHRVRARQQSVGYDGDYMAWIRQMTPSDLQ